MDKTVFAQKSKLKKFAVATGSKNEPLKYVNDNFPFTINSCLDDNCFVLAPIFVSSSQLLNRDVMDEFTIEGSVIIFSEGISELQDIY